MPVTQYRVMTVSRKSREKRDSSPPSGAIRVTATLTSAFSPLKGMRPRSMRQVRGCGGVVSLPRDAPTSTKPVHGWRRAPSQDPGPGAEGDPTRGPGRGNIRHRTPAPELLHRI
jgi:hypothetical protein